MNEDVEKINEETRVAVLRAQSETNVFYNTPEGMNAHEYRAFMMSDDY